MLHKPLSLLYKQCDSLAYGLLVPNSHTVCIQENLDLSDWEIPEAEFNALSNLEVQQRAGGDLDNKTAYWWELITEDGPYRKPADLWDD